MSGNTDLENKTIEALRHYREAFATVENQERGEVSAHRALTRMLPDWVAPSSKTVRHPQAEPV